MKTITLLLDGAGDKSYEILNWKTPLQYANTPNLDKMAKKAQCGIMTPYKQGVSLGTDLAHFILFGYDKKEYPGRAVIDAVGENVFFTDKDLVIRTSWANVEENTDEGYYLKSRFTKELTKEEVEELIKVTPKEIDGYEFNTFHSYDSHGLVVVCGDDLSDKVSDSDPFCTNQYVMKVEAFETEEKSAKKTAEIINKFLKQTNENYKTHLVNINRKEKDLELANMMLCKWAGKNKKIEDFYEQNGMTGVLVGKSKLLEGISKMVGMEYIKYESFEEAIEIALESDFEYVHLHTKDPDEASHKKNPMLKVKAIEEIDEKIGKLLDFDGLLIVTADHSTPCSGKMIHSGESVPFLAMGNGVRRDDVSKFDEISCSRGSVNIKGKEFMNFIQNATDRGTLVHFRAGSKRKNYRVINVNRL